MGGEAGREVEAVVAELRICMASLWAARRLEWSYSEKSGLEFMAWVYWLLAEVSLKMSFSWMASWKMAVRVKIW